MVTFDYKQKGSELGLGPDEIRQLEESVQRDYPGDAMMQEIRMMRTLRAIQDGLVTVSNVLEEAARSRPR